MKNLIELDIVLCRDGERLALEGDQWPALVRLAESRGLDPNLYSAPHEGGLTCVSEDAAAKLARCLDQALDVVPDQRDCNQRHGRNSDPYSTPPLEFFAETCVSYLDNVLQFAERGAFSLEVAEPISFVVAEPNPECS